MRGRGLPEGCWRKFTIAEEEEVGERGVGKNPTALLGSWQSPASLQHRASKQIGRLEGQGGAKKKEPIQILMSAMLGAGGGKG